MAKDKKTGKTVKGDRPKQVLSIRVDADLLDEYDEWRNSQEFPPNSGLVIEKLIREFLDARK